MADGLSALSSETLTAAVTCLLQKPLPESQFIKSKPANNKDLTNSGILGSFNTRQQSLNNPKESQYNKVQPLALPIYQAIIQDTGQHATSSLSVANSSTGQQMTNLKSAQSNQGQQIINQQLLQSNPGHGIVIQQSLQSNQCHQIVNQDLLQTSHGQHIVLQQPLQTNQEKRQDGSFNNKLKLSVDNIHLALPSPSDGPKVQDSIPQSSANCFGNFTTIPDHGVNSMIKQPVNNVHLQNITSLTEQRNNIPLPNAAGIQTGANQSNGLGLLQNMSGVSLLQQLLNIQNQNSNLNGGSFPVLSTHVPHQAPSTDAPVETPFSQLSPTQPLQNLIQNLFSQADTSGLPHTSQTPEENYTSTPVSYASFDNELHSTANKQRMPGIPSTTKEQENTYATHISLLMEAISKNKTLPPQQFHQIQKSILSNIETEERLSADSLIDQGQGQNHVVHSQGQNPVLQVQGQNPVLQGQGQIETLQGEGSESVLQKSLQGLPGLQPMPMILQRAMPGGQFQLIPLTRLGLENRQSLQKNTPAVASPGNEDDKGPVHIQPKPAYLNVHGMLQTGQMNIASPVDLNTVYNMIHAQHLIKETRVPEALDGNQPASSLTAQQIYNERTSQFSEEMPETSPQEAELNYEAAAVDEDTSVDDYSAGVHADIPSQNVVEIINDTEDMPDADPVMEESAEAEGTRHQEGTEDNYVFCIDCRKLCKDQCEFHNNVEYKSIPDTPILSKARASLPSIFYLQQSSTSDLKDHLGVWCSESINERTRFGPVVGVQDTIKTEEYKQQLKGFNPYELSIKDDMTMVLDVDNENTSNWTMFVRMAHSLLEQNCILYRQLDEFYIITIFEIKEHEELLFWFSQDLCQHLGLSGDPGVVKMQQCEYCGKYFTTKKLLKKHLEFYHHEQSQYKCSFEMCGKQCSSQSRLNNHMLTHMGMKPYECTRCGKRFSDASNVKAHMNIHTGVKKFQCEICGKSFRQKAHRDVHVITHTGDKKFKCTYCDKSFARPADLRTHTYRHTNELQYVCNYCNKVFYKTQALKKHLKVHTGERNYMCGKCFKGFQTKYHRDRHLKICKERNSKETSYMSLEEVAKLDSTCDGVPLKKVKPDDHVTDHSDVQNQTGGKISHTYYNA